MIHPINTAMLDSIDAAVPGKPIYMLNLLRFRGETGWAAYFGDYVTAFRAIAAELAIDGIERFWLGDVAAAIAAPADEAWDAVVIVRYPSLAAFRAIVDSPAYRERAEPHRLAALADWRLIAQTEIEVPA